MRRITRASHHAAPAALRQRTTLSFAARSFCTTAANKSTNSTCTSKSESEDDDTKITPWEVETSNPSGINYSRVVESFKSQTVDDALVERFARIVATSTATKRKKEGDNNTEQKKHELHHFFKRRIAFSHRDLDSILDEYEAGRRFYIYTGRGPSALSMHIGHVLPFVLCKYLQEVFDCPLVVQITDDEKHLFRSIPFNQLDKMTANNIRDIVAFGLNPSKTFIFRNTEFMNSDMYRTVIEIQKALTCNAVKNTFGITDSDNIGKISFPAIQAAPCFVSTFRRKVFPMKTNNMRCLVPCAIDQDPFFVLTRGVSERLKRPKPSLLHTRFLPALKGPQRKMSSSQEENGVILLTDSNEAIKQKIRGAFSGGSGTIAELKERGPNLAVDVAFQLLVHFWDDDEGLAQVEKDYVQGTMNSGDVKHVATRVITEFVEGWRERRNAVTDEKVREFMEERALF